MFDIVVILYFIYQIIFGWRQGFVDVLLRFIISIISLILIFVIFTFFKKVFLQNIVYILLIWLLFIVSKSILYFIIKNLTKILHKIPIIGLLNRILGSTLAGLLAIIVIFAAISLLKAFAPLSTEIKMILEKSILFHSKF
ncbi:MAG: hypothetical protein GX909_05015 [Clostridiaceae bacterium]|nr:hypothetical protein [Clostridiaceae bacterium]